MVNEQLMSRRGRRRRSSRSGQTGCRRHSRQSAPRQTRRRATAAAQAASRAALVCLAALSHLHSSLIWSLERALADGTARPPHRDRTPPLAVVLPSPSGAWTAEPAEVRGADKRRL